MSYRATLIAVAEDCPVAASAVPRLRGGRRTVAVVQYELLAGRPYRLTHDDVLFESWLRRRPDAAALAEDERAALRAEFFARPQACLRTSPLPKKYGFGLHFDDAGRAALCPVESEEYARLAAGPAGVTVVRAMRSSRG